MKEWVRDLLTIIGFGWTLQIALDLLGLGDNPWAWTSILAVGIATFAFALWMGMLDSRKG